MNSQSDYVGNTMRVTTGLLVGSAAFTLRCGIWASMVSILLTLCYLVAMMANGMSSSGFPPVEPYDVIISVISLFSGVSILVLFAILGVVYSHQCIPGERKVFSQAALAFATLFAGLTSINRFAHLAIIRPALVAGIHQGIEWFTPYGAYSVMTALENLAWGFFLGLAFVFLAPAFTGGKLERTLRGILLGNETLCLISVLALPACITWLTYVGVIAWGPGFTILCVVLIVWFRHYQRLQSGEKL